RTLKKTSCNSFLKFFFKIKSINTEIYKKNWKPNIVYLYQFYRREEVLPSLSPFCLKVETWLRANQIQYESINCLFTRSNKGLLPFIELNGEHIADSQLIIQHLQKYFKIEARKRLYQHGIGRHSRDDIISILHNDIRAVDLILGDKKFLFGDKPTTADFTVFAHLATTYFLPYRQPITDLLDEKFPRTKALIVRMRAHYFPEWKYPT
ncbi:unnamed protein product, partial [Dracunculus medinensis]|uniref:GST N-terminal domain-containing protein n=1 Tax=Dracunculus medinensis TaxID=318479 RepID=A0A158Q2Y3_DRAME